MTWKKTHGRWRPSTIPLWNLGSKPSLEASSISGRGRNQGMFFFGSSLMFSDRILNLNSTIVYRCILQRTTEKLPMRITGLALGHSVWYPHGYRSHLFCPDMDVLCCSRWPASQWTYGNQYLDVYPSSKVGNSHIIPQQFRWVIQNPPTKIEKAS